MFQYNLIVPAGHHNCAPTDFTILEAYQCKNGKTHASEPLSLHHSYAAQCRNHSRYSRLAIEDLDANKPLDDNDEEEEDNSENDGTPPVQSLAMHHSRIDKARGLKDTQMGFYSGAWVDVLKDAKNLYHLHVHVTDPFPEHNLKTLQDAHDCLLEAITMYQESPEPTPLNNSKQYLRPFLCHISDLCNFPELYKKHAMSVLVSTIILIIPLRHTHLYSADL